MMHRESASGAQIPQAREGGFASLRNLPLREFFFDDPTAEEH